MTIRRASHLRRCAATVLLALSTICWAACGPSTPNPSSGSVGASVLPRSLADKSKCAVTKPPEPPFVPPSPYSTFPGKDEFLYGTPGLWAIVYPNWHVHSGGKLPFWRQGFDWRKEGRPRLTVVARRLDGEGPLVWNDLVGSGGPAEGKGVEDIFMVTGIDVPSSGCWEITARYAAVEPEIQTLSYTVWVSN